MEIYLAYLLDGVQTCSGVSGLDKIPAGLTRWFESLALIRGVETGRVTCLNTKFRGRQPPLTLRVTGVSKENLSVSERESRFGPGGRCLESRHTWEVPWL